MAVLEAGHDGQCSRCGGKITAGQRIEYLAASGKFPASSSHYPTCPEPKAVRGVNLAQARDPEDVYALLRCKGKCRRDYSVPWDDPASRREPFVCPLCVEKAEEKRSHLKVVA